MCVRNHEKIFRLPSMVAVALLGLFTVSVSSARDGDVNADESHLAIHGYDPVAYFEKGEPIQGSAQFESVWQKERWRFSSAENRDRFAADPKAWAPQYGGYCAYAASLGHFADTNPSAWSIVKGKLYLNYSLQVRKTWRPRAKEFIGDADQLWPTMDKATYFADE